MSTRAYDYLIQVSNSVNFKTGDIVYGSNTGSIADIISINNDTLKIRMANTFQTFDVSERLISHKAIMNSVHKINDCTASVADFVQFYSLPIANVSSDSVQVYVGSTLVPKDEYTVTSNSVFFNKLVIKDADVSSLDKTNYIKIQSNLFVEVITGDTEAPSFISSNLLSYVETANSSITSISGSPFINAKNSRSQTPIVKLISIYYPGEWYPPKENGNPGQTGDSLSWPFEFPIRFAEFVGEPITDYNSGIIFAGRKYKSIAMNSGEFSTDSTGTINGTSLEISNFDGKIASLIENKNIVGFSSAGVTAYVNGELVNNIDPRTILGNPQYNSDVATRKGSNTAMSFSDSQEMGGTWTSLIEDSRDLLGAVVEIKMTYAKFLDVWPEYSIATSSTTTSVTVKSAELYRIGDKITYSNAANLVVYTLYDPITETSSMLYATITNIVDNTLYFEAVPSFLPEEGHAILILNETADPNSYSEFLFVIDQMDEMNDFVAKFSLTNWLQYFKMNIPKRKFFSTTCPWRYKGKECKYTGTGDIIGSNPTISSNGYFTISNETTLDPALDFCPGTLKACALRKNLVNFGGFISNDDEE